MLKLMMILILLLGIIWVLVMLRQSFKLLRETQKKDPK